MKKYVNTYSKNPEALDTFTVTLYGGDTYYRVEVFDDSAYSPCFEMTKILKHPDQKEDQFAWGYMGANKYNLLIIRDGNRLKSIHYASYNPQYDKRTEEEYFDNLVEECLQELVAINSKFI